LSAINAAAVKVDLMAPTTSAPLPVRLVFFGPDSTSNRWTSTVAQTVPNDGVWRNYTFSVGEDDLTRVLGSSQYSDLYAEVIRTMLRFDPDSPSSSGPLVPSPGGTLNIDNIALVAADVPPTPGDFNDDGTVDGNDLDDPVAGWRARFGNDLDGNDFLVWQRQLGAPTGGLPAALRVPEPTAATLTILAVIGAGLGRPNARFAAKPTP
jgi:hypothetical protein